MEYRKIILELSRNKQVFNELLSGVEAEVYLWKSSPDRWSLLEIICHLYDEEREDFRYRMGHVLESPEKALPKIEPSQWVDERNYITQDFSVMLQKFLSEREISLDWLNKMNEPDPNKFIMHPEYGKMTARSFLCSWLAHDYLHIRQITKLKYDYLAKTSGENILYAGNWI
jgi:hypothetical protein